MPPLANIIVAIVLVVVIGAIAAHADSQEARKHSEATASRAWVARQQCGSAPHHWANDLTLVCAPEARP